MLEINASFHPIGAKEDLKVGVNMNSVEITYNPIAIKRLMNFFDVHSKDEVLKEIIFNKIEEQYSRAEKTIQEISKNALKKKFNIKINTPIIILPFT